MLDIFSNVPGVKARKGPDTNGADLELEFDSGGLEIAGLEKREICAVQAKSYEGTMGYDRAIEDIKRAFDSNKDYTCGLIVSTALELTKAFEAKLDALREQSSKPVGLLIGRYLAYFILRHGFGG
jgi:hypothetical protein